MEAVIRKSDYLQAVGAIKEAIQITRYRTTRLVNRELLAMYYAIGKYISESSRAAQWGSGALASISASLQESLPGLRGFSEGNMRKMRIFYEQWSDVFESRASVTHELQAALLFEHIPIRALATHEFSETQMEAFLSIGFTHHYEIIKKTESLQERLSYIERCATEFWNVETLKYHLAERKSELRPAVNNFSTTISDERLRSKAIASFRDEYNLPFVEINDDNDFPEKSLELQIVDNIKTFMMALGSGFTYMGNQYRLIVEGKEYFLDLLFFNRKIHSLVCLELKYGEFKPEYAGKLNFYLSALDDLVRLPDENPSIGIILCRSKNEKTVEYAFRDMTKPMGVATYKSAGELPEQYNNILPSAEELKKLMK